MRVIAPFFAVLASITTMAAAAVRLWWSKPRYREINDDVTGYRVDVEDPRASPWLRTAAKWWLILVFFGGTIIGLIIVAYTLISLS